MYWSFYVYLNSISKKKLVCMLRSKFECALMFSELGQTPSSAMTSVTSNWVLSHMYTVNWDTALVSLCLCWCLFCGCCLWSGIMPCCSVFYPNVQQSVLGLPQFCIMIFLVKSSSFCWSIPTSFCYELPSLDTFSSVNVINCSLPSWEIHTRGLPSHSHSQDNLLAKISTGWFMLIVLLLQFWK